MTLKEKITKAVTIPFSYEEKIIQCEQIADDFAIGFVEWVDEISFSPLDSVDYHLYQSHTITELLQIYKKEKQL